MPAPRALSSVPEQPARKTRWIDAELMAVDFPEPRWAVPGLLCEGLNLLAGPPKLGKSWLSLGLGAAIANGDSALNAIEVERGPVLYCALEDTGRRLQRRRRQMLAAEGRAAPLLTLETACPMMAHGGEALLCEWLDANPHGMSVYAAAVRFKTLADHYGVPFLLIHHVRKQSADDFQDLVPGTNGLTGAVDATLVLKRSRGQADGVLHVTGRDVEEAEYAMSFDAACGAWTKLDGPAGDYQLHDTRALIARFVRDHPGSRPAAIAEALQLKPNTVRQTCSRMAKDSQLHAAPNGAYFPPGGSDSDTTPQASQLSLRHPPVPDQGEHP